jgi:4-hydroxybenzoate polyprenyltransferase
VWNDILDREFDRQVGEGCTMSKPPYCVTSDHHSAERTKHRPIADGRVSVQGAFVFLAMHLVLLFALLWPLNTLAYVHRLLDEFQLTQVHAIAGR